MDRSLEKGLSQFHGKKIIAYGTGEEGRDIIPYLKREAKLYLLGVCNSRVVSQGTWTCQEMEFSIRSIEEWKSAAPDAVILITTPEKYHEEIAEACKRAGFADIIPAWKELLDASRMRVYAYYEKELATWTKDIGASFQRPASTRPPQVIVSLTSYPKRIGVVHQAIKTLLEQTVLPDRIILWLADSQFPNRERDLPEELTALCSSLFEIRWTKDIKSYKKLIPALAEFPDDILITVDDDIFQSPYMLERLLAGYKERPECIQCHRFATFDYTALDDIQVTWAEKVHVVPTYLHQLLGGCGCLFPPHSLHPDVSREDLFMKLAPTSDDLWFWAMGVLNRCKVNVVEDNILQLDLIPGTDENALWKTNSALGKNYYFVHIRNVLCYYPILQDLLAYEQAAIDQLEKN